MIIITNNIKTITHVVRHCFICNVCNQSQILNLIVYLAYEVRTFLLTIIKLLMQVSHDKFYEAHPFYEVKVSNVKITISCYKALSLSRK